MVNGPTSKRPASDGDRCNGQLLMICSTVCSGSPHAAPSASPHFFVDALYQPTQFANLTFRLPQSDGVHHFYFKIGSNPPCNIDTLIIKATFATLKY